MGVNCRCIDEARPAYVAVNAKKIADEALNRFGALPQGLADMTFENYKQMPEWRQDEADSALHALKVCLRYGENRDNLPFLTIFGPVGAGKTHLAMAIAQSNESPAMWANVPELLSYLRSTFDRNVAASFHQELERIKTSYLLVLDDLASERQTEWATEQLYQIVNHRPHKSAAHGDNDERQHSEDGGPHRVPNQGLSHRTGGASRRRRQPVAAQEEIGKERVMAEEDKKNLLGDSHQGGQARGLAERERRGRIRPGADLHGAGQVGPAEVCGPNAP